MSVAERIRSQVEFSAEAQRKTTGAENSVVLSVTASITRTALTRFLSLSYTSSVTMENGINVMRPVAIAAGNVDDCELK